MRKKIIRGGKIMISSALARTAEIEESEARTVLEGFAASAGIAEGPAKVFTDAEQLTVVENGSIVVFGTASPKLAAVMDKLAGLVTGRGGLIGGASHYAREQGVPCVTAVEGIEAISDGQMIRVDGHEGTVTLL